MAVYLPTLSGLHNCNSLFARYVDLCSRFFLFLGVARPLFAACQQRSWMFAIVPLDCVVCLTTNAHLAKKHLLRRLREDS